MDLVGIAGASVFLFGFWRTSLGKWKGTSFYFELDNLVGAVLMSIYAYSKGAYVSIALNAVWAIVAFKGVSSYAERRLVRSKAFAKGYKRAQKRK